jgi:hypothetical protein
VLRLAQQPEIHLQLQSSAAWAAMGCTFEIFAYDMNGAPEGAEIVSRPLGSAVGATAVAEFPESPPADCRQQVLEGGQIHRQYGPTQCSAECPRCHPSMHWEEGQFKASLLARP